MILGLRTTPRPTFGVHVEDNAIAHANRALVVRVLTGTLVLLGNKVCVGPESGWIMRYTVANELLCTGSSLIRRVVINPLRIRVDDFIYCSVPELDKTAGSGEEHQMDFFSETGSNFDHDRFIV